MNSDVTTREQCLPEIERLEGERDEARAVARTWWWSAYDELHLVHPGEFEKDLEKWPWLAREDEG